VAMGACVPTFLRFAGDERSNHNLQLGVLELRTARSWSTPTRPRRCWSSLPCYQKLPMLSVFGDQRIWPHRR
jgi:hypothetical protein